MNDPPDLPFLAASTAANDLTLCSGFDPNWSWPAPTPVDDLTPHTPPTIVWEPMVNASEQLPIHAHSTSPATASAPFRPMSTGAHQSFGAAYTATAFAPIADCAYTPFVASPPPVETARFTSASPMATPLASPLASAVPADQVLQLLRMTEQICSVLQPLTAACKEAASSKSNFH